MGGPASLHRASLAQKGWGKRAQHRLHWGRQCGQAIRGGPASLLSVRLAQSGWVKGPAQMALGAGSGSRPHWVAQPACTGQA